MARSEERKPTEPIPDHSRMDDEAQRRRSDHFRAMTQGPGRQMIYGSGDPKNVPKPKARKAAKK